MKIFCSTHSDDILNLFAKYVGTDIWFKCNYYEHYRPPMNRNLHPSKTVYVRVLSRERHIYASSEDGYIFNIIICDKRKITDYSEKTLRNAVGNRKYYKDSWILDELVPIFPLETISTEEIFGGFDSEIESVIGKDIWIKVQYHNDHIGGFYFINISSKSGSNIQYRWITDKNMRDIFNNAEIEKYAYECITIALDPTWTHTMPIESLQVVYPVEAYTTEEIKEAFENCEVFGYDDDDDEDYEDEEDWEDDEE